MLTLSTNPERNPLQKFQINSVFGNFVPIWTSTRFWNLEYWEPQNLQERKLFSLLFQPQCLAQVCYTKTVKVVFRKVVFPCRNPSLEMKYKPQIFQNRVFLSILWKSKHILRRKSWTELINWFFPRAVNMNKKKKKRRHNHVLVLLFLYFYTSL